MHIKRSLLVEGIGVFTPPFDGLLVSPCSGAVVVDGSKVSSRQGQHHEGGKRRRRTTNSASSPNCEKSPEMEEVRRQPTNDDSSYMAMTLRHQDSQQEQEGEERGGEQEEENATTKNRTKTTSGEKVPKNGDQTQTQHQAKDNEEYQLMKKISCSSDSFSSTHLAVPSQCMNNKR
jgi:hypothetical protein